MLRPFSFVLLLLLPILLIAAIAFSGHSDAAPFPGNPHWASTTSPVRIPVLLQGHVSMNPQVVANVLAGWSVTGVVQLELVGIRDDICRGPTQAEFFQGSTPNHIEICHSSASFAVGFNFHNYAWYETDGQGHFYRGKVVVASGDSPVSSVNLCHEIGHLLGFDHSNDSCVGNAARYVNGWYCPTAKDYAELAQFYGHTDSYTTPASSEAIVQGVTPCALSATPTPVSQATPTPPPASTPTAIPTNSPTVTPTISPPLATATVTMTPAPSPTVIATPTHTPTVVSTFAATPTRTPTRTPTPVLRTCRLRWGDTYIETYGSLTREQCAEHGQ